VVGMCVGLCVRVCVCVRASVSVVTFVSVTNSRWQLRAILETSSNEFCLKT